MMQLIEVKKEYGHYLEDPTDQRSSNVHDDALLAKAVGLMLASADESVSKLSSGLDPLLKINLSYYEISDTLNAAIKGFAELIIAVH